MLCREAAGECELVQHDRLPGAEAVQLGGAALTGGRKGCLILQVYPESSSRASGEHERRARARLLAVYVGYVCWEQRQ